MVLRVLRYFSGEETRLSCSGEAIRITYSECVLVALGMQHGIRMRRIVLSSPSCPAVQYFFTLSHTRQDFRKMSQ
jgi:hypothetical protein